MKTNQKYLIVDDDTDDIDFFCEAIDEIDVSGRCITAGNGEDALYLLREEMEVLPDLIFLDLNMPKMDGKDCLKELKKDETLKNIPVVIYTTSTHFKDREETLSLGAAHFLVKATSFKQLSRDIESTIKAIGKEKDLGVT